MEPLLIGVLVLVILIVAYLWYTQMKEGFETNLSVDSRGQFNRDLDKLQWGEEVPTTNLTTEMAKQDRLFDGSKYTGDLKKWFPESNDYPTVSDRQLHIASNNMYDQYDINGYGNFNPDDLNSTAKQISNSYASGDGFDYDDLIMTQNVGEKEQKLHLEWAVQRRPYSGIPRSVDDEFEIQNYINWRGVRLPQATFQSRNALFQTEVTPEDLAKNPPIKL